MKKFQMFCSSNDHVDEENVTNSLFLVLAKNTSENVLIKKYTAQVFHKLFLRCECIGALAVRIEN